MKFPVAPDFSFILVLEVGTARRLNANETAQVHLVPVRLEFGSSIDSRA